MTPGAAGTIVQFSLPLAAAIVVFIRPRWAVPVTLASGVALLAAALGVAGAVLQQGAWRQAIGGWAAPLGIGWTVDGLSAALLLLTAAVGLAGAVFHAARPASRAPVRDPRFFWPLWLFLWGGLNALFLSADLFNIYVALELVSIASVGLIGLAGGSAQAAAWRYLLATLLGSTIYLLGVALLYGRYAALDFALLAANVDSDLITAVAAALMTLGLLLKAAVFPLHFWLPAAHGRAPPAVSAVLSAVVIAAAYYLLVRLWFGPFAPLLGREVATLLGLLGAAAVLWGGLQALLQRHLKMLIAYSTVSQLGYGLLVFPLAAAGATAQAWSGAVMLVLAHGLAKAALFLAAGAIVLRHGIGRLQALGGDQQGAVIAWVAFAIASASLIGLPPTGGFVGKWWLAQAALATGEYFWLAVLMLGTAFTAAYLWRALQAAVLPGWNVTDGRSTLSAALGLSALALALGATALGLAAPTVAALLAAELPALP
ncbi:complex I subunit 5 family protein [Thioalkalivibrio paradoxus]|uniref:Oxidoreductase n=1 Tax=Thioalkalivibrio paradoxus ARh 1 TaxID=713585 RepID=W0DG06_9GAMM|nr:proton-conducting transporter membrane subunit [Thioalkalivibrio paradoxus]AHE97584.1 oxidoreductase [Thioalkalivibrio paradoxus ARh 1]